MTRTKKPTEYKTKGGTVLSDDEIEKMSEEVAQREYDVEQIKARRGRPRLGDKPSAVVPVRVDPDMRAALTHRAEHDHSTASKVIREALREYLAKSRS